MRGFGRAEGCGWSLSLYAASLMGLVIVVGFEDPFRLVWLGQIEFLGCGGARPAGCDGRV